MSNYPQYFFLCLCAFFFPAAQAAVHESPDSLREQANKDFLYENYEAAVRNYSQLVEAGLHDEQLFYRLAYLHDELGQYPEAVYYLQKLRWHSDDPLVSDRLTLTRERADVSIPAGEPPSAWILHLVHYQWYWAGGILLLMLLSGAALLLRRWPGRTRLAGGLAGVALVAALVLLISVQRYQPRAVIVMPTYFYDAPGYGATRLSLPLQAGSTVVLGESSDIWRQIEANGQSAWVPAFALAPLDEWQSF